MQPTLKRIAHLLPQQVVGILSITLAIGLSPMTNLKANAQNSQSDPSKQTKQNQPLPALEGVRSLELQASTEMNPLTDPMWSEITLPTQNGRLQWKDIGASLADSMHLDRQMVQSKFPKGVIDLNAPLSIFVLVGIELTFGDTITIRPVANPDGTESLWIRCRSDAFGLAASAPEYGPVTVDIDPEWQERATKRPLIVLIHGLKGDARNFDDFRAFLHAQEYPTAVVQYDDRSSISDTASKVAVAVKQISEGWVPKGIVLIGHSMGGLVAREWVEQDDLWNDDIRALVTVASPHGGSSWARLPPLLNLITTGRMKVDDLLGVLTHEPSEAGIRDLIPGSEFLKTLNSRPKKTGTDYLNIMGTGSPVTTDEISQLRQTLHSIDQEGTLFRLVRPRIAPLMNSFEELEAGRGDGVVAVANAKIAGVENEISVPLSHVDMFRRPPTAQAIQPVWQAILKCINELNE